MSRNFIILIIFTLVCLNVQAGKFPDVEETHWAYSAVENLSSLGIIRGVPSRDGKLMFCGERPITRYEFAVALDRAVKVMIEKSTGTGLILDSKLTELKGEDLQLRPQLLDELKQGVMDLNARVSVNQKDISMVAERVRTLETNMQGSGMSGDTRQKTIFWLSVGSVVISSAALFIAISN